jgi:hypothetical protein
LAEQIAQLKLSLSQGQQLGTSGTAGTGWGLGTSPYAVAPKEAPGANPENKQGNQSQGSVPATNFEPLYAPEDQAHGAHDEKVRGKLNLANPPQKVEEIRSAPESQEALANYAGVVSAYAEGEETAINREEVPLEYQELVRGYFDELEKSAREEKAKTKKDEKAKAKKGESAKKEKSGK